MTWRATLLFARSSPRRARATTGCLRRATLFPRDEMEGLLGVQLFFAKLIGCTVVAEEAEVPLKELSKCIREGRVVPDLWITVCSYRHDGRMSGAGRGRMQALTTGDRVISLMMMYFIDTALFYLTYGLDGATLVPRRAWIPALSIDRIRFGPVSELPNRTKIVRSLASSESISQPPRPSAPARDAHSAAS